MHLYAGFLQTGRVLGVVLRVRAHLGRVYCASHGVHLYDQRSFALESHGGINHRIVGQHIACLQLNGGFLECGFERHRHFKVHFIGFEVYTRPVNLFPRGFAVRNLYSSVRLRQVCHHRIHRKMDAVQVQIRTDLAFVQLHLSQVAQAYFGFRFAFGTTIQRYLFRQEISEVRQIGIEIELQVQQHVAQQVIHLTFGTHLRLFGFGCQSVDCHVGCLSLIEVEHGVGIQFHVPQRVRQRFITSFAVFELQLCGDERHGVFAVRAFGSGVQLHLAIHIQVFETLRELLRHQSQ